MRAAFSKVSCDRHGVQAALRNPGIMRHGAVDAIAEAETVGIQVIESATSVWGKLVNDGGGFAHNAIAFLEILHSLSRLLDRAAELVTENAGVIHFPAVSAMPLVQVSCRKY